MPENNSDIDKLLASAQQEIGDKEAEQGLRKKVQEEKMIQLISDLDVRLKQISPRPKSSIVPFVSDLKTETKSIDSLGFSSELIDSGDLEKNEVEKLRASLQELSDEFFKKEEVVNNLLGNDLLSKDKKEEIKKAWEISSAELETEKETLYDALTSQEREMSNKKGSYKEAQKTQNKLYRYYSKINGASLFEKLVTEDTDSEWFFENLLTKEEQEYILRLREERDQGEDVLLQKNLIDAAKLRTIERVKKEIDKRLEKTIGVKESLEDLFLLEERDKKVFDAAKQYIVDTIGEDVWGDLGKRVKEQAEESKVDIEAWKTNQKGLGKNNRINRKKRLIDVAEPLRKKRKDIYNKGWEQSCNMRNFLYELDQAKYLFEECGKKLEKMKCWEDGASELQEVARHLYEILPKNKILKEIDALESATFLDADQEHQITEQLEKLKNYLSRTRNVSIKNLNDFIQEKRGSLNKTSEEISDELNKFPRTPENYYSKED